MAGSKKAGQTNKEGLARLCLRVSHTTNDSIIPTASVFRWPNELAFPRGCSSCDEPTTQLMFLEDQGVTRRPDPGS
jgi:hypothetical protein